jgi:hypothetical protein
VPIRESASGKVAKNCAEGVTFLDLGDFIDVCDIRATANASRELWRRPPDIRAKPGCEQSRSVGQKARLTLAAVRLSIACAARQLAMRRQPLQAVLQDASFFIRSDLGTLGAGTPGALARKACSQP